MALEFRAAARGSRHVGVRLPPSFDTDPLLVERFRRPSVRRREVTPPLELPRGRWWPGLTALLLALSVAAFVPRALSYVRLHEAATGFANYALCMVGPTGPSTLQDRPREFWRLVRRRLVAAPAESRPFEACASLLEEFEDAAAKRLVHGARAMEFREYAPGAEAPARLSAADLEVTAGRFRQLARDAWPFAPDDPAALVQPSRNARGAAHPMDLPVPARGRGLPSADLGYGAVRSTPEGYLLVAGREANLLAYGSRDGGKSWVSLDAASDAARANAGRCGVGDAATTFRFSSEGEQLRVESWRDAELQTSFPLVSADARLLAVSCDLGAALALVAGETGAGPRLSFCPHSSRCRELGLPREMQEMAKGRVAASVARVRGAIVFSLADRSLVRVVSSRDDGETWTPPVVAFDRDDPTAHAQSVIPTRLLALEGRVLLYAGAESEKATYPVLGSDDFGASWRALAGGS